MSLTDRMITDELECAICMEVMKEPVSLNCQHNFCRECIASVLASGTEEEEGEIRCPTCRKRSRVPTGDQLPENKLLATMCDAARRAKSETCPHHPETRAEYYCTTCDVITCDKCAIIGGHRGHDICELVTAAATCRAGLQRVQSAHREREQKVATVHARIDATYNGLKTRIDEKARAVIEAVETQSAIAKEKLRHEQLAKKEAASASIHALNTLDVVGKLAALPRLDGQAAAVHAAERGLQNFQAPKWGKEQADEAFRRFEALEPFKAIEEAAQNALFQPKPEFQIFVRNLVTTKSKTVAVDVTDDTTVGELKGILAVPCDRSGLVFQGKVLEDARTMAQYNIGREATIEMRLFARELSARGKVAEAVDGVRRPNNLYQIHVKPHAQIHRKITLDVTPADKICEVKLLTRAQMEMDVHPDQLVLIFAGRHLPDKSTLAECAVYEHSTLHLVVKGV